jgi:hypothetical protein
MATRPTSGSGGCGGGTEVSDVLDGGGGEQCIAAKGKRAQGAGQGQRPGVVSGLGKRGWGESVRW